MITEFASNGEQLDKALNKEVPTGVATEAPSNDAYVDEGGVLAAVTASRIARPPKNWPKNWKP